LNQRSKNKKEENEYVQGISLMKKKEQRRDKKYRKKKKKWQHEDILRRM
jgi:hypothetical protein